MDAEVLAELQAWLISLDEKMKEVQSQMKAILESSSPVVAVEVVVTKLEPTQDDIIIFWMPSNLTNAQIRQIGMSFDKVIEGRFRYIMLVRDAVEVEMISGVSRLPRVQ